MTISSPLGRPRRSDVIPVLSMTQLLYKFTLQSAKFHPAVLVCVALVWIAVIGCAITSINSQPFTPRQRSFWIVVVDDLPNHRTSCVSPFFFSERGPSTALSFEAAQARRGGIGTHPERYPTVTARIPPPPRATLPVGQRLAAHECPS